MTPAPVFLSHTEALKPDAAALYAALKAAGLQVSGHVALLPGDPWDELHYAQREARVTAALIEPDAAHDWYQSDDIVRAIALQQEGRHRVLPIYRGAAPPAITPRGFERLLPQLWPATEDPAATVEAIRRLAEAMAAAPTPSPPSPATTVFLLYARDDADYAAWMAGALHTAGFAPRLKAWDLTAGQNEVLYEDGQLRADRVLLLLTAHALADPKLMGAWTAAFHADPTGARAQLVPVRLDDTPPPALLGPRVPIDLRPHLDDADAAAAALVAALKPPPKTAAAFPGRRSKP